MLIYQMVIVILIYHSSHSNVFKIDLIFLNYFNEVFKMTTNSEELRVIRYTTRSCVVIGPTYPHRDEFKAAGGRWYRSLPQLQDGLVKVKAGWLYSLDRQDEIERLVSNIRLRMRIPAPKIKARAEPVVSTTVSSIEPKGANTESPIAASSTSDVGVTKKADVLHTIDSQGMLETSVTIEEHVKNGKKYRVTTTTVIRTEALSENNETVPREELDLLSL